MKHDGGDWQPAKNALRALALNARDKYLIDVALAKQDVRMTQARTSCGRASSLHARQGEVHDRRERGRRTCGRTSTRAATLLADACCGAEPFDQAFREFAKKLYPDKKLEVIPTDDLLYSEKLNGEAITTLRCRTEKADGSRRRRRSRTCRRCWRASRSTAGGR